VSGCCSGGAGTDAAYHPFALPANEAIDVVFSQSPQPSSVTLGAACNTGSVRVEQLDGAGACTAAVPGTLVRGDRTLSFVPDQPWAAGARYRLVLVSGSNNACNAGEICDSTGDAASFDPLAGNANDDGGGPNLVIDFVGAPASTGTFLITRASPATDTNGSGFVETGEVRRDENRAALHITGTTGAISNAEFTSPDCLPGMPGRQACMYVLGAMPVTMGELSTTCPLPGGATAPSCVPVTLAPSAMYATSISMDATVGFDIGTDTGMSVMRVREPATGPVTGYIIEDAGTPTMVVALDLYMDAPDMSVPLSDHDLHSKLISVVLRGPVTFLPDGRIAITLASTADVPVEVNIDAPLGVSGAVKMIVPAGEMKLQLVSPSPRGGAR